MYRKIGIQIWGALALAVSVICGISSCDKQPKKPPYNLNPETKSGIVVSYEELGGVKIIPVKLNGITMKMIYDTGCSGLHLSLNELQTLYKNGKLDEGDILGASYSTIADGSIVKNGLINIRKIEIGGEDGLVLENVQASVALNQDAPILLGNSVLDELASVEVDNVEKTITFHKK
ncbi:MAG: retroviral-like aspartic protease family protein [Paramuribaculum sp.]|nr:retroviral-like aspartic protease family protein [Paramuribaculum sp.]